MRRNWLAGAAVAAAAVSVPVTVLSTPAQAATTANSATSAAAAWNATAARLAKKLVGDRYRYGGTSPATGFDCSGLTQWVYKHTGHGKKIDRIAEDQYRDFKRISKKDAKPGDLVFFHDTSSPSSYVYHVGVYEGGNNMVAATTSGHGVKLQSFTWAGNTVTFGTITHK
jgi:cell wall-associated NlpC family hydrolase